jgi:hypothetical protein
VAELKELESCGSVTYLIFSGMWHPLKRFLYLLKEIPHEKITPLGNFVGRCSGRLWQKRSTRTCC